MSSLTMLWIILAPVLLIVGVRGQQRCHVCVPGPGASSEVERLFPGTPLVICHQGTEQRLCPPDYRGCLTQTKGEQVMRTCAPLGVHECRSANGVEYCYCMGDLCNAPPVMEATSDDEDLLEGSGLEPDNRHITEQSVVEETNRPNTTKGSVPAGTSTLTPWSLLVLVLLVAVWR